MKKKFIYILVGMVCFLSFNNGVRADYKKICQYQSTYELVYQNNCKNPTTIISIYHDQNNSKPYKIEMTRVCRHDDNNNHGDNTYTKEIKKIEKQKDLVFNNQLYFYDDFKNNKCPNNVLFSKNNDDFICFYNNDNGKKWCAKKSNASNTKSETVDDKYFAIGNPQDISLGTYSNVSSGTKCDVSLPLKGSSGASWTCYLRFEYVNNDLTISYSDKNPETNPNSLKQATGDYFKFGKDYIGLGEKSREVPTMVYFRNTNADLNSKSVLVNSFEEFKKKYMEEWNKNKTCPTISADPIGKIISDEHHYWLLFGDAVQDARENNSDNVDTDKVVELKPWTYKWPNFIDMNATYDDCEGLLGEEIIDEINNILLIIRIAVPILLLALGIMDFAKAVFSTTEDAMKKAQVKFIKRLIMAIVVFLVPTVINVIMTTVDGVWAHINNNACNIWK